MRTETRVAFNRYLANIAQASGATSAAEKFAVSPTVQQKLENKMQETSAFLKAINLIGVTEAQGQKLGLGLGGPSAARTDTTKADRTTRDLSTLDARDYQCYQTNYDTHISYAKLDAWAKFPDFQVRVANMLVERQALDRIMIGFNGTSVAADTNITTNPLLQDVNKGWLQHAREFSAGAKFLHEVAAGSKKIAIGNAVTAANGYKNLDALVMDMIANLIEPWFREDPSLRVVLGRGLLADKYFPLVNKEQDNTQSIAADMIISQKRIGGLPAVTAPFVPDGTLMITTLSNLSIYYQTGGRRRTVVDNAKRDRIEDYQSSNDAYVVEDFGCFAAAENITME